TSRRIRSASSGRCSSTRRGEVMADWRDRAERAKELLQDDASDEATRTKCMLDHVENEENRDDYISKDFFNVQQTAGGLPDTMTFDQFVQAIAGHVREDLTSDSFSEDLGDDDFRTALMSIDANIRRHIQFLNGVVHQIAPGEVHLGLWQFILDSRSDAA